MIRLIDNNDLEALLGRLVNLLCLGDLFQEILNDNTIVVADIGGGDFEVVNGSDDVKLELAVGRGLEHSSIDLDLLDTRTVKLLQSSYDTGLLSSARGAVYEEVREVAALGLNSR